MKIAIIGFGSIGKKHFELLEGKENVELAIVTSQDLGKENVFSSMIDCVTKFEPQVVWICTKTSDHLDSISILNSMGFKGQVLVEKPLHLNLDQVSKIRDLNIYVSYNLRFHQLLGQLRRELSGQKALQVIAYVGQYLPNWRPGRDYRENYSAHKNQGGGVLRDLSHELDYLNYLFGAPSQVIAKGGQHSSLEIDSDDLWSIIMTCEKAPVVNLSMNYLDRVLRRTLLVHTDDHSYELDFIVGTLTKDKTCLKSDVFISNSFEEQANAVSKNEFSKFCSIEEALQVENIIEMVEKSNRAQEFVLI